MNPNKYSRRDVVLTAIKAGGCLGLKSLLLGLPPSFLTHRAFAAGTPQFLVFSESSAGDPVNCNVPGSYVPGVWRASQTNFVNPPTYNFGTKAFQAAVPWGILDADLRARLNFFHHRTGASAHPESRSVMSIHGSIIGETGSGSEMLPSVVAQENAAALGTIQKQPISLSGLVSYKGLDLAVNQPDRIKAMFAGSQSQSQKDIMNFRDQQLDIIYADLKANGTQAQKRFLNEFSLSRNQAKTLAESLSAYLADVSGNSEADQVKTAAALIALNATPVVRIELSFGGDNHFDTILDDEAAQTTAGAANINLLWRELKKYGAENKTTFAMLNVFGRTLGFRGGGRTHYSDHNVMVSFGPKINGGVVGGLDANLKASGINSTTGLMASPDINPDNTHHAAAKSLFAATGIAETRINERITAGKIIRSYVKV